MGTTLASSFTIQFGAPMEYYRELTKSPLLTLNDQPSTFTKLICIIITNWLMYNANIIFYTLPHCTLMHLHYKLLDSAPINKGLELRPNHNAPNAIMPVCIHEYN